MPATMFIPSESIARANCLASFSVGNVLVCLIGADFNRRCFGASNETNHGFVVTIRPAMGNPIVKGIPCAVR